MDVEQYYLDLKTQEPINYDGLIILTRTEIRQIVDIMLADLIKRLNNQEINLEILDDVKDYLAQEGYSQTYGARPLRRVIQKKIEDPIAEEILTGMYADGDTIKLSLDDKKIVFERVQGKKPEAKENKENKKEPKEDSKVLESQE
jgi:ATP-dependent Clp protease ATP-binding subunit ClpA